MSLTWLALQAKGYPKPVSEKRPFAAKPDFRFIEELYGKYYEDSEQSKQES